MPARSIASQEASSSSRCCGSIASASRGEIPKNPASKSRGVADEPALAGVRGARGVAVRVVEGVEVPAAVVGERRRSRRCRSATSCHRSSGADPAGEAAAHPDDGDGVVLGGVRGERPSGRRHRVTADDLAVQEPRQRGHVRVVEDQRGRQLQAGHGAQPAAQLDRGEGVEAQVPEGPVRLDVRGAAVPEHERDLLPDGVHQQAFAVRRVQRQQPVTQRRSRAAAVGGGRLGVGIQRLQGLGDAVQQRAPAGPR